MPLPGAGVTFFAAAKKVTKESSYGADCPIAVVFRASWPDEERVCSTLADIAMKVRAAGIERTALIVVGRVLDAEGFADSSLYGGGGG